VENERLNARNSIFTVDPPDVVKKKSGTLSQEAKAPLQNSAKARWTLQSVVYSNTTSSSLKKTMPNLLNANANAEEAKCSVANAKKTWRKKLNRFLEAHREKEKKQRIY